MRQIKTKGAKKSNAVRDIKVKTQVGADDMGPIKATGANEPATYEEVEESTILINPDVDSMESRG